MCQHRWKQCDEIGTGNGAVYSREDRQGHYHPAFAPDPCKSFIPKALGLAFSREQDMPQLAEKVEWHNIT